MKTAVVLAGSAPGWVRNQVRLVAELLTEDGRVLIAMSNGAEVEDHLPGSNANSTLFGVARSGYPLWTGRLSSVVGFRRRHDRVVLVRFDGDRHILLAVAAVTARLRNEKLVVQDLSTSTRVGSTRRLTSRLIESLTQVHADRSTTAPLGGPSIALVLCGSDSELARLAVSSVRAMSSDTRDSWRFVVQSSDPEIERLVDEVSSEGHISFEPAGPVGDLVASSDVIVIRNGETLPATVVRRAEGAGLVVVDRPSGQRMGPRIDGAWLVRSDVSSVIVALEHFRKARLGGPATTEVRDDGHRLVEAIRNVPLVSA
jgi:hypothetical protein